MKKILILPLIFILFAVSFSAVFADTTVDLIAGKNMNVGEVTTNYSGGVLKVTYSTNGNWKLSETHLAIANDAADLPQTKSGNAIPGKFEFSAVHDPMVDEYTYEIVLANYNIKWDETYYIAAHAVVAEVEGMDAPYYADFVYDYSQGLRKDGTPVVQARSYPENALYYETGRDESNFFSLGFGGYMILEYDCPIYNGEGYDIRVIEDTWGAPYPLEKAEVYASNDGEDWKLLGTADNTNLDVIHTVSFFDLETVGMSEARYIKVVDVSNPAIHNNAGDGYDLNAVEALQNCYYEIGEETAWGQGCGFSGKDWSMYFADIGLCGQYPSCESE